MRTQEDLQKLFDGRESNLGGEMEDHAENCECDHCLVFKWNTNIPEGFYTKSANHLPEPLPETYYISERPALEISQEEAAQLNTFYSGVEA